MGRPLSLCMPSTCGTEKMAVFDHVNAACEEHLATAAQS